MKAVNLVNIILASVIIGGCDPVEINNQDPGENPGAGPDPIEEEFPLVPGGETVLSIEAVNCTRVARVVGKSMESIPSPNDTPKRFNMASTDFGNMWDTGNGSVFSIFGDNFNSYGGDWLSNAIAVSTDRDMSDGLYYDSMLWDDARKKRKEIIHHEDYEVTCIPTGGVSVLVNGKPRQYVNYMSIKQWALGGDNDSWSTNHSELVYSDDMGETWVKSGVKWGGNSSFAQIAYVVRDDLVYMWGTPSGRHGNVFVSKVPSASVLDKNAYEYWDGASWVRDEAAAVAVANGEVSEMTVRYNTYYKRYIMMYLDVKERKLVYRDAERPEGEWSAEKMVMSGTYGPSIHPWFCDGRDLWFVSSTVTSDPKVNYDTWHIFLYHAKLRADEEGFNMVYEGGFEYDKDNGISYRTLWDAPNAITSHDAHSGTTSCKVVNNSSGEWKDACVQKVFVHKHTDYVITGYAKAGVAGSRDAYLGVRLPSGEIHDHNPALSPDEWTLIRKEFNSGDNTALDVFFGTWGEQGQYAIIDDIKLEPKK